MADFLVRVELVPWTAENFRLVTRLMLGDGFRNELTDASRPERLPPGEFVIGGALTLEEVEHRAVSLLRSFGCPFAVLVTRYSELRYAQSAMRGGIRRVETGLPGPTLQ